MRPLLFDKWVFRGYQSLDDFIHNTNPIYETRDYPYVNRDPNKHKDKIIWILSKYFFGGGKKNAKLWESLENGKNFSDCIFVYEDHEESSNLDYRWIEVMRRRRRGVYIKDACPSHIAETEVSHNMDIPIIMPGYFPVYDKWDWKPFSIYQFNRKNSPFKKLDFSNRDIDVLFIGSPGSRRDTYINQISRAAKKLNIKSVISSNKVSFEEHINLMRRSKISYQFMAIGYRSSREWETMLNGSMLISDDRTVDFVNTPGMVVGEDFVKYHPESVCDQMAYWLSHNEEREKVASCGFSSAWSVWEGCTDAYMPSRKKASTEIMKAGWIK